MSNITNISIWRLGLMVVLKEGKEEAVVKVVPTYDGQHWENPQKELSTVQHEFGEGEEKLQLLQVCGDPMNPNTMQLLLIHHHPELRYL